ncbi:hypothetical protein H2201_007454 [Coniosporium apollinis]|uniref:Transcription factor domain-containing protein n=1 Tax=Coniosporium apollinis TaxID=61459 RepID=A0ABQ9NQP9_9PEZI|nr:hypothetical protein H2201_007454 [Coniosporium apollinis]
MSVASLLSGPPGEGHGASAEVTTHKRQYPQANTRDNTTTYGYDTGQPDVDVPRNDDINAITLFSPPLSRTYFDFDGNPLSNRDGSISPARSRPVAFERGGYYAKPVPIRISKELEPLPSMLLENPINLLYFHHFLNHTARILVPHDCDQNAFRTVLPQMAVKDPNLLSLLLAFSASHRSRLLSHAEPRTRIAEWVQDVFPNLRQALASEPENITTANLTTAIMLASLEIIAPNTFEVTISWQNHLQVARQMIVGRGGLAKVSRKDKVAYFLSRWFAYLDVLGSLSGRKNDWPLSSAYWSHESVEDEEEDLQIDCFLGFTGRFNGILARIAELAKRVEPLRIDAESNEIREQWRPDADIVEEAAALKEELERSMNGVYRGCSFHHHAPSGSTCAAETGLGSAVPPDSEAEDAWDALELHATNMAFHWAGLVHLNRRILNLPSSDPAVQDAVREIVGQLYKVRRGGNAEACLVFPMFTAGVEMRWEQWEDIPVAKMKRLEELREMIAERLAALEGVGMGQVNRARTLMQKVWDTGRPWETLSSGEFFG